MTEDKRYRKYKRQKYRQRKKKKKEKRERKRGGGNWKNVVVFLKKTLNCFVKIFVTINKTSPLHTHTHTHTQNPQTHALRRPARHLPPGIFI